MGDIEIKCYFTQKMYCVLKNSHAELDVIRAQREIIKKYL